MARRSTPGLNYRTLKIGYRAVKQGHMSPHQIQYFARHVAPNYRNPVTTKSGQRVR